MKLSTEMKGRATMRTKSVRTHARPLWSDGLSVHEPLGAARYFATVPSPIGELLLTSDGCNLTGLHLEGVDPDAVLGREAVKDEAVFSAVFDQLEEYFEGRRRHFDLRVALSGTAFQRKVWEALTRIDYGATKSYGEIADEVGHPRAYRAVGSANGANPVALIVPCHRVIASDGTLGGYGGGLERKTVLLEIERRALGLSDRSASSAS
jgi:methylated-DNA-[protein]-cysteine S-methyltransferase